MTRPILVALILFFGFCAGCTSGSTHTLSLEIKDGTEIPNLVMAGHTVSAYFTLTNTASVAQSDTIILSLPANTTRVSTNGTYDDTCPQTITLAALESCTLQLTITGAVSQQLRVCKQFGSSCINNNDLGVREITAVNLTPENPHLHIGTTQQMTATATFADDTTEDITELVSWNSSDTSITTISDNGLATGVGLGEASITIGLGTFSSDEIPLDVVEVTAYLANRFLNTVSICTINTESEQLTNCADSGAGATFNFPIGLHLSTDKTKLYVANDTANNISVCDIDHDDGTLSNCTLTGTLLNQPVDLYFNSTGTLAFVANEADNQITVCNVDAEDGSFSNCALTGDGAILTTNDILLNTTNTFAYISDLNLNAVFICDVSELGALQNCTDSGQGTTFSNTKGLILNEDGTQIYVDEGVITVCDIDTETGLLNNCNDTGYTGAGLQFFVFNELNTKVYATKSLFGVNSVVMCDVDDETGFFENCTDAAGDGTASFTGVAGIVLK
ncbi:beta-propeller fold lactonase family protein [bacterium]|nr:beta-propeller fold lactonase family protein [bacterium]